MKKYWWGLLSVLVVTFTILGFYGSEIYRQAPPIYKSIQTTSGKVLYTDEDILDGQVVWQSIGGQQIGSIWGHGAYQAPDWTADWLHRELVTFQNLTSLEMFNKEYDQSNDIEKAQVKSVVLNAYRKSKVVDGVVHISENRAKAFEETKNYYMSLFSNSKELRETRKAYAIHEEVLPSVINREKMTYFFHWSTWAASANRPGKIYTYTNK